MKNMVHISHTHTRKILSIDQVLISGISPSALSPVTRSPSHPAATEHFVLFPAYLPSSIRNGDRQPPPRSLLPLPPPPRSTWSLFLGLGFGVCLLFLLLYRFGRVAGLARAFDCFLGSEGGFALDWGGIIKCVSFRFF